MSDLVDRAAKTMCEGDGFHWLPEPPDAVCIDYRATARAALLAALDPEDKALVERAARALGQFYVGGDVGGDRVVSAWCGDAEALARAAIAALRELVEGEDAPQYERAAFRAL